MSINIKKYTKEQMAKMVEEAQEAQENAESTAAMYISDVTDLKVKNAALTETVAQMNGEFINRANEIANLKADADALRTKHADTEAALGRANAHIVTMGAEKDQQTKELIEWQKSAQALHDDLLNARERAKYAEEHPWRNLWAWVKRNMVRRGRGK